MLNIFKNKFTLLLLMLIVLGLLWGMKKSLVYENIEFDTDKALKEKVSEVAYFDKKIVTAIENENFDDVETYQQLADFLHIPLEQSTKDKIAESNTFLVKSVRNTKEFSSGFISGTGESAVAIAGSITSDMTVIGDLRDLSREGMKLANNEKYDEVTLSLATIGIGLTATQLFSAGTTTPLKVGASLMKVAKKTGKISKTFLKVISSKLTKVVDMKLLKKIDLSSATGIKKFAPTLSKSLKLKGVSKLFGNVSQIKKNTSVFDTISLLKYVDDEKDLEKVVKISSKYKKNTKGVFKILGKTALRGSTKVIKYTTVFMTQLIMAILSFVGFLIGLFINIKMGWAWIRRAKA